MEDFEFQGTERFQICAVPRCGWGWHGGGLRGVRPRQNATVALKTLHTPSVDALLRLKREFRSLQNVQHSNLVTLGELIEERGTWFFTMELIVACRYSSTSRRGGHASRARKTR